MPYTLQQARTKQDEANRLADFTTDPSARQRYMNDVMFWTGYMAAMIDHDCPREMEVKFPLPKDFQAIVDLGAKLGK